MVDIHDNILLKVQSASRDALLINLVDLDTVGIFIIKDTRATVM